MSGRPNKALFLTGAHIVVLVTCITLVGCNRSEKSQREPIIAFSQVPQWSTGDRNEQDVIEGTVRGERQGQRMVLYSKCGGLWWLQPVLGYPFTAILPNKQWRNEVHLGTEYAALLVYPSYHPAPALRSLPEPGGGVAQVALARGQDQSSSFFVNFSGFRWRVRWKPSDRGGATNTYNPNNVFTDGDGALHLLIVKRNQQWTCSEVNLTRNLGYGTYSFIVEDTARLDPALVFGILSWDYSTYDQNNREFDVNVSRWGDPYNKNAEFTLQPTFLPSNVSRFAAPGGKLRHTIVWKPGRITMITSRADAPSGAPAVWRRVFTSEVPTPGVETVRMTLYVYWKGKSGASGLQHGAEVVVDRFQFLP